MKPFYDLTMNGKARRLRQLAFNALEWYDLDVARLELITNQFNCIFRLDTADGQKYVLRVLLPGELTDAEVRSQAQWVAALRQDMNLNVPEPLLNRDGDLVTVAEAPGVPEPRQCMVVSWIPGNNLADQLSVENLEKLGTFMARLHAHAASFVPPEGFTLKTYDEVFPFNEPVVLLDEAYGSDLFEEADRVLLRYAIDRAQEALDRLLKNGSALQVQHIDLHQWNVKVFRGELYAIDFDDTMFAFPVQDIAITLYGLQDHEHYAAYRAALQRGYEQILPWPERFPGEIDTWIVARGIDMLNFVLQSPEAEHRAEAEYLFDLVKSSLEILKQQDLQHMRR